MEKTIRMEQVMQLKAKESYGRGNGTGIHSGNFMEVIDVHKRRSVMNETMKEGKKRKLQHTNEDWRMTPWLHYGIQLRNSVAVHSGKIMEAIDGHNNDAT